MTDPDDLEAIFEVDALTDPRLRNEAGDILLVLPEDHISGPGTSDIMASFAHLNPAGSRFGDSTDNDLDAAPLGTESVDLVAAPTRKLTRS
ncbi:MAG: hypothetical protein OXL68_11165 [Paracoccaceae bacterium]|nr:hypothetical protein [Paracoccaceae bacterium]